MFAPHPTSPEHAGMLAIFILVLLLTFGVSQWAAARHEAAMQAATKERAPAANTAAEMVRLFLAYEGVDDVEIVEHGGTVTNYFDPRRRRLFLSPEVADGTTMGAWAVALHEAAHATQSGEAKGEFLWRQTVIKLTRYGPVLAALGAGGLIFLRLPPRIAAIVFVATCLLILLLNLGTLAIEFNANARLQRFLEKHLQRWPSVQDKLNTYLQAVALREVGDLLRSPRYFFFSALPGSGSSRPKKPLDK